MPELDFRGKEFVRNHHLTVPYRPLVPDADRSLGNPDLNGNLIIQGDNLEALASLMPMYAGRVDCVFIDPPYNTGNEGWAYNDNVNSDVIKAWFSENPVGLEDGLRHDKWCAMMWPRLKLLHQLLADTGSIWVTIDDNEVHHLRCLLDEIFGDNNALIQCAWQKKYAAKSDAKHISSMHDHILIYAKDVTKVQVYGLERTAEQNARYQNPDNDPRGAWTSGDLLRSEYRPGSDFILLSPTGKEWRPPRGTSWRFPQAKMNKLKEENRIWFGYDGNNMPRLKRFLSDVRDSVPATSIWGFKEVGSSDSAKKHLSRLLPELRIDRFTPKPVELLERVLTLACPDGGIVLDSFAGTGTTGDACIRRIATGKPYKFLLVELEEAGAEVCRQRINACQKDAAPSSLEQMGERSLIDLEEYETATLWGVRKKLLVRETLCDQAIVDAIPPVLGVAYCTLGEPLELSRLLAGEGLPAREAVADYLIFLAGDNPQFKTREHEPEGLSHAYVGKVEATHYWLLYEADRAFLTSPGASLTLDMAKAIHAFDPFHPHRVYSPEKAVSNKTLRTVAPRIEAIPLPYALFRRYGG
jgi:adenine-specific DNA-methyltransferase